MREKFFLYLTDDAVFLYSESFEKLLAFKSIYEEAKDELKKLVTYAPKNHLCILIDRSHQDVREEKLPPLLPWDRVRFLFHKKAEWISQGGYAGWQLLKEKREIYLRWVHILPNDSLMPWLLWAQSLPNPWGGIFFVSLEAGNFMENHFPRSTDYRMLFYNLPAQKPRHVIFKGSRLLLTRLSNGEEDILTSLHFLSRTHPDIHRKLQVLSLVKDVSLPFSHMTTLSDPQAFTRFLASQRRPSLIIRCLGSSKNLWLRRGGVMVYASLFLMAFIAIYQGLDFKKKAFSFLPEIEILKIQIPEHQLLLKNKNILSLRKSVEHYHQLKSHSVNPLETIVQLSILLDKHKIRLESLTWRKEKQLELELTFLMKGKAGRSLANHFESFLASCNEIFSQCEVQVLIAPFNSSSHEIFKNPLRTSYPLTHIKMICP